MRNIHRFFSSNVSYNGCNFNFMGRGSYLLLIFIFALLMPVFIVSLMVFHYHTGVVFSAEKINIGQL